MLVTLVDTLVFAGPLETDERSFYVHINYTRHVVLNNGPRRLGGWEIYSKNGEYPIKILTRGQLRMG